jgi:hypothetical protein
LALGTIDTAGPARPHGNHNERPAAAEKGNAQGGPMTDKMRTTVLFYGLTAVATIAMIVAIYVSS